MTLPIVSIVASLFIFSGGYYVGQYSHPNKTPSIPLHTVKNIVQSDKDTVVENEPRCINSMSTSDEVTVDSLVERPSKPTTNSSAITDKPDKKINTIEDAPPPLSESELLKNIIPENDELLAMEEEFYKADIALLELTIADMIEKGEPSELAEELRADLRQLRQQRDTYKEPDSGDSVDMTDEELRDELVQDLINNGLIEESELMARDMLPDVDNNPAPAEIETPPPEIETSPPRGDDS